MKFHAVLLVWALGAATSVSAEIQSDWAYHAAGSGSRWTVSVPGEGFPFLANGTDQISNDDTVTLYLVTANQFAGDRDEQIHVRWWDGAMSHWIMGSWVKNITVDSETPLCGQPTEGSVVLDLWKIEIPPWITQPGQNFYAIQLKGFSPDSSVERYLLSKPGGDFSRTNNLGQIWSASEEFDGQDWMVNIWQ